MNLAVVSALYFILAGQFNEEFLRKSYNQKLGFIQCINLFTRK